MISPETEAKLDEQQRQRKYAMLGRYESQRAEAIATHYLRHAMVARSIIELVQLSRKTSAPDADKIIESLVSQITKNHASDLGIKLEWINEAP